VLQIDRQTDRQKTENTGEFHIAVGIAQHVINCFPTEMGRKKNKTIEEHVIPVTARPMMYCNTNPYRDT
jgi:hypothetical protein